MVLVDVGSRSLVLKVEVFFVLWCVFCLGKGGEFIERGERSF